MTRLLIMLAATACATAPKTATERYSLESEATNTLHQMIARDPHLDNVVSHSAGYVVFPEIGKAGFGVGGAFGRGVLFEHGKPKGFVKLTQASYGLQAGAEGLAELVVFSDRMAIAKVKSGTFELGGNMSAVVIKEGAAISAKFVEGVAVFQMPRGGLMVEASIAGQHLSYEGG